MKRLQFRLQCRRPSENPAESSYLSGACGSEIWRIAGASPRCKRGALPTELIARAQISRVFRTAPQARHAPVAVRRPVGADRDDPQPFRWWAAVWQPTVSHAGRARWRRRPSRSAMSRAVSSFQLTCRTKLIDLKAKPIRSLALSDSAMHQNLMPQGLIAADGSGSGPKEDGEGAPILPLDPNPPRNREKDAVRFALILPPSGVGSGSSRQSACRPIVAKPR